MNEAAMGDDIYLALLKAIIPVFWTYGSPYLTRGVVWVLLHVTTGVSPHIQEAISSLIGASIGALAGTMDNFPLHADSAAIMGATGGGLGQKLLATSPGKIQGEQ
jgi:hypothetical protein